MRFQVEQETNPQPLIDCYQAADEGKKTVERFIRAGNVNRHGQQPKTEANDDVGGFNFQKMDEGEGDNGRLDGCLVAIAQEGDGNRSVCLISLRKNSALVRPKRLTI